MNVHNSKMLPGFIFMNLILFVPHCSVEAFHIDKKPMIYINLFDEILTDNASTKILLSTPSPEHHSTTDLKKKLNLTEELFRLNDMNNTSASAPYDSLLEFDMPSKADITENSVNASDLNSSTSGTSELIEPDFLEPELTRMFFLRAMASLMEHIMVALFSDTTGKLNESPSFDYELTSQRNLSKRELPNEESVEQKTNSSKVASTGSLHVNHSSTIDNSTDMLELLKASEKSAQTEPEKSSHTGTLGSEHLSSHHGSHITSDNRVHAGKRENSARLIGGLKNDPEIEFHPEAGIINQAKHNIHKHIPFRTAPVDDDYMKMFPLSEDSSELNDDMRNKKDTHSHEGMHFSEDQDQTEKEEDSTAKSAFVVTIILIGTTALVLMLLGALALAAGYFFRKNQANENQNTSDVNTSVA